MHLINRQKANKMSYSIFDNIEPESFYQEFVEESQVEEDEEEDSLWPLEEDEEII